MAATVLILMVFVVMVVCAVLAVLGCKRVLRRRCERRRWKDLVARHQELDRVLNEIWQRR